ncbi:MAG: zincin-like metallopeptidase domain-containing protein [Saprospiraceae bacterium]
MSLHSTGHSSRLARPGVMDFNGFGSTSYSKEELVAEIELHFFVLIPKLIVMIPLSKTMLRIWLDGSKVMKEDPKFIFQVS